MEVLYSDPGGKIAPVLSMNSVPELSALRTNLCLIGADLCEPGRKERQPFSAVASSNAY